MSAKYSALLGVTLAVGGLLHPAGATIITIQPSIQDAFVEQDSPKQIFGAGPSNTRIRVQNASATQAVWRGLVQFDLSAIPQFSTINSATLTLTQAIGVSQARTHGIHVTDSSWLQSAVKWNNQPTFQSTPSATFAVIASPGEHAFSMSVTADVQAWVNTPTTNHGWFIRDQNETTGAKITVPYYSKEESQGSNLADRPKLVVDFTGPACSTDPQCADTNPCTINERCAGGNCAVDPLDCDDTDPCTDDICDPSQGCLHPSICNDGFDCTTDTCNPSTLACTNTPVDSACTMGGCKVATCMPNDQNADPQTGCVVTAINPNGTSCDDGLFCTTSETCLGGNCQGGTPTNCADTSACTVDSCNETTNQCVHDPVPLNGSVCDDGQFCTTGTTCLGGVCQGGSPTNCADTNPCTADSCNEATDQCVHDPVPLNGTSCSDGQFCTDPDTCQNGSCQGPSRNCADTNPCTADSCNETSDMCVHDPVPLNGSSCEDGQFCTVNDVCQGGTCTAGPARNCADFLQCTFDFCDENANQCVHDPAPLNGSPCNDGLFCTVTDICQAGSCAGSPRNCADTNPCTVDSCNEAGDVCVHDAAAANGTGCDDGQFCTVGETCQGGACQGAPRDCSSAGNQCNNGVCDEGGNQCVAQPKPNGTPCSDGDACTSGETCQAGGCVGGVLNLDGCQDDFLCYKAKPTSHFTRINGVTLVDEFETVRVDLLKLRHLCTPADKNGEGVHDQATHLQSYRVKASFGEPRHLKRLNNVINNQIGQLSLDTIRPDLLLVPTAKSLASPPVAPPNPSTHNVDHYKCYKVRVTPGTPKFPKNVQVQVADQFTSPPKTFILKRPRHLCTPVDKNGEGIKNAEAHMVCYQAKGAKGQPKHQKRSPVFLHDQFGPRPVTTVKEDELCIPSAKGTGASTTTSTTIPGSTTTTTLPPATTTSTSSSTSSTGLATTTSRSSSSSSSSSTSTSSTTSTTIGASCCGSPIPTQLTFTTAIGSGNCGTAKNTDGSTFKTLGCGGLYFGGGVNAVPLPAAVPDMGTSIVKVTSCAGNQNLVLAAAASGELGATQRTCSKAGCFFGPPLPIPNTASTPTSTCVLNIVAADATGTADCIAGGSSINLPLTSEIYLSGDLFPNAPGIQTCPVCNRTCNAGTNSGGPCNSDAGCPGAGAGSCAGSNVCHGGANDNTGCAPADSASLGSAYPTTHDCPPDPLDDIGGLPIGFALTTGSVTRTGVPSGSQTRVFCGYCRDADGTGSFQQPAVKCFENGQSLATCTQPNESCEQNFQGAFGPGGGLVKTITETGVPAGNMTDHALHASTLVSVFCIPPTFNSTVDQTANLPGPGAVALSGQAQLQ